MKLNRKKYNLLFIRNYIGLKQSLMAVEEICFRLFHATMIEIWSLQVGGRSYDEDLETRVSVYLTKRPSEVIRRPSEEPQRSSRRMFHHYCSVFVN